MISTEQDHRFDAFLWLGFYHLIILTVIPPYLIGVRVFSWQQPAVLESSVPVISYLPHPSQSTAYWLEISSFLATGAALFDMEYARWLAERCKLMSVLRNALQAHPPEGNLGVLVDECIRHYDELFQLKATVAKADVFHLLNGTWKTPAERCFLWMGGFKPSELLNVSFHASHSPTLYTCAAITSSC